MKITITIEDSQPWYWPFSSQEAWLEHEKLKHKREDMRWEQNEGWNAHELDNLPQFKWPDAFKDYLKHSKLTDSTDNRSISQRSDD